MVLRDAKATKKNVMAELSQLVDKAVDGTADHIVLTFSSHGTQIPDTSGDEPDRLDEAFACYDINNAGDAWDPDTVISDDELSAIFERLPDGVLMDVILDTCHSGTGLKSLDLLPGRRPRFLPAPTPKAVIASENSDVRTLRDMVKAAKHSKPVLMAACRSDQTAADAYFDGRYNGAFTYHLARSLQSDGSLGRADLLKLVSKALKAGGFDQGGATGRHDGGPQGSVGKLTLGQAAGGQTSVHEGPSSACIPGDAYSPVEWNLALTPEEAASSMSCSSSEPNSSPCRSLSMTGFRAA
ncbi:caspase family protein [Paenarthrobacter ureafaciens]